MRRLLIRPGAIGDLIVSLPALEFLKSDYTEVWTAAVNAPLVRFADCVACISSSGIDGLEPNLQRLEGFDSIVSWYGTNRPDFRAAVEHLPFEFFPALPHGIGHAVDFYLAQVGAPLGQAPRLAVGPTEPRFAAIHPFSGSAKKNWPLERFREVANQLPVPVEWTAGPEETLEGANRFDNLWTLAQWLAGALIYIGNDSGISHLAAAVGTPVVALFGPSNPDVWAPRGVDVRVVAAPDGTMESIAIDEVLAAVAHLRR